jgi:hypothetical protein
MKQISIILLFFILVFSSCSSQKESLEDMTLNTGDHVKYFSIEYKNDQDVLKAEPLPHLDNQNISVIIDSLLNRLSAYYSRKYSSLEQSDVKFELETMSLINTTAKDYKIALINIEDPGNIMERGYFQGSTGGKNTQDKILLNIMQPHIEGFIDGVIIHINNKPVGAMDHVNFEGIKSSSDYKHLSTRVQK